MMKIAWCSDFDPVGSGYQGISTALSEELVRHGHEVKALGLHYGGQEHDFPFSIVPIATLREAVIAIHNLRAMWNFDVLVVALDIPVQNTILSELQNIKSTFRYVGIMPVEADPLCTSWAMVLLQMDLPLIISQFGTEEAHKANVLAARHIPLGVDHTTWVPATPEERTKYRKGLLGISDPDTFVITTVADNQERKNLWASLEIFRRFSTSRPNSRYVLVTRESNPVGWSLRDLIFEMGIQDKVILMERGMPKDQLRGVYASSDAFLLTSKAEGLGMPLLEAMAMRIPCVATDCTGMQELLSDRRGLLVPPQMVIRDPFGNGRRYWIDIEDAVYALLRLQEGTITVDLDAAQQYVQKMTWTESGEFLNGCLLDLEEVRYGTQS